MPDAVVVAAARSPIGRAAKGSLTGVRPDDLLAQVVAAALGRVPQLDPRQVDDLLVGCAEPWGEHGNNLARVVAVLLGLDDVPAATVNRFCASSLQTTRSAFHAIALGEADVVLSAGVECVSRYDGVAGAGQGRADWWNPRFSGSGERARAVATSGTPWRDPRAGGDLPDVHLAMGLTAENVAGLRQVSRQAQDDWALQSQHRAVRAIEQGWFDAEVVPVQVPGRDQYVGRDDSPRPGTTAAGLSALAPAFREGGSVTAGNCCPLSDGAAALVLMSDVRARALGVRPLARVVSTGVSALSPEIMGLGPVEAARRAVHRAGLRVADLDLVELNEAFAAQVIPCVDDLALDPGRVNVHGGAIALGHPFGATGARMITTLLGALERTEGRYGMAALCVGGGQGMAVVLERVG